jgi:hypothetical protein
MNLGHPLQQNQFSVAIWRFFPFLNGHLEQNIAFSEICLAFWGFFTPKK